MLGFRKSTIERASKLLSNADECYLRDGRLSRLVNTNGNDCGYGNDREGFAKRRPPDAGDHCGPQSGFAGDAVLVGAHLVRDSTLLAAGNCSERPASAAVTPPLVFLGPSLKRAEAASLIAADFRPPARRGDIYRGLIDGYTTIVLIDGEFHGQPSVWQREIVDALFEGAVVHGASSMGALRAAELHTLGMAGHGRIFAWYRDGVIDGDDEVALTYGPAELGYPALSEPLVNIRATLAAAVPNIITAEEHTMLLESVRRLYFPSRSFAALLDASPASTWPTVRRDALSRFLVKERIDQKRLDAIAALTTIASGVAEEPRVRPTPASRPHWYREERLVAEGFAPRLAALDPAAIARRAGIADNHLQVMKQALSTLFFVGEWARSRGIVATVDDLALERARFPAAAGPPRRVEAALTERAIATAAVRAFAAGHDIDSETARRGIILQWASENGIERPGLCGEKLVDWLVEMTPVYFGYQWHFSVTLIEALELDGCGGGLRSEPLS
jgi:hypothetical protein